MIEIQQIARIFIRRWWLIVVPVAIVAVVTLPNLFQTPATQTSFATRFTYSASQVLNLPAREGDYQDVWLASEFVVNAFTEWVRSTTFRQELASYLGDDVDLAGFAVASDNARSIGVVQMSYPTAEGLERIAQAAIAVLQERNADYFPHLEGEPARVTILDEPIITPNPPPLTNRLTPILQIGIAFLFGVGLTLSAHYTDPRLYDAHELTQQGLTVLGKIPPAS